MHNTNITDSTSYDTTYLLVAKWFLKVIHEEINEEILLISSTEKISLDIITSFVRKIVQNTIPFMGKLPLSSIRLKASKYNSENNEKIKDMSKYQFISDTYSIYILDSHRTDIIQEIKNYKNKNKNIILVTSKNYHYSDLSRTLLCLHLQDKSLTNNFLHETDIQHLKYLIEHNIDAPKISYYERYLYYREFLPIVKIIEHKKYDTIQMFINFYINETARIPLNIDKLLEETSYKNNTYNLYDLIEADVYLFKNYEILTSRLAIIIYRLSFLNLEASKTKIGLFFKNKLKTKSQTINLNSLDVEYINQDLNEKSFRGYILKKEKQNSDNNIHLEIAKKLLKYGVDINIIVKSTKLSAKKIYSLL